MQKPTLEKLSRIAVAMRNFNLQQSSLQKVLPLSVQIDSQKQVVQYAEKLGTPEGLMALSQEREKKLKAVTGGHLTERVSSLMARKPIKDNSYDNVCLSPTLRVYGEYVNPPAPPGSLLNSPSGQDLERLDHDLSRLFKNSVSAGLSNKDIEDQVIFFFNGRGLGQTAGLDYLSLHTLAQNEVVPNVKSLLLGEVSVHNVESLSFTAFSRTDEPLALDWLGLLNESELQELSTKFLITALYAEHLPTELMSLLNDAPLLSQDFLKQCATRFVDIVEKLSPAQQTKAVTRLITGLGRMSDPDAALEGRANQYTAQLDAAYGSVAEVLMPKVDIVERTVFRSFVDSELAQRNIVLAPQFTYSTYAS